MEQPTARGARLVAAVVSGLQALALVGFVAFYLYELIQGEGSDTTRVVMSGLVILVFAVGIAVLARGWMTAAAWPRTPTIVWNLLLLPVGFSLSQADLRLLGGTVVLSAVVAIVAAAKARRPEDDSARDA